MAGGFPCIGQDLEPATLRSQHDRFPKAVRDCSYSPCLSNWVTRCPYWLEWVLENRRLTSSQRLHSGQVALRSFKNHLEESPDADFSSCFALAFR
jgi:hypothetical protein